MTVRPEDLARTLLARKRRELEAHVCRAEHLRRVLSEEMRSSLAGGEIRRAWLIGSLANGHFGEGSDVDVVVEGLREGFHAELWWRLADRLKSEVDLLELEALPESFRERVLSEGSLLP